MRRRGTRQRKTDPSRDPEPEQRGKKGPRPGAVRTDDLGAAITSILELAVMAIGRVVAFERAARALDRATKAQHIRAAHGPGSDLMATVLAKTLRHDERREIVREALRRVRVTGARVRWAEDLLSVSPPETPSIKELRRLTLAELSAAYEGLKAEVVATAGQLRKGFGERGRNRLLEAKIGEVGRFFRALHPDWGSKKTDEYTAKLLGLGNESAIRRRRRKRATAA